MIRVCPHCSNVDVNKLKETVGAENVKTGCVGACRAFDKDAVVRVDGVLLIKPNEEDLLNELQK